MDTLLDMFTGLVQSTARVQSLEHRAFGIHLRLDWGNCQPAEFASKPIAEGDSICVSGVCLTVAQCETGCDTGQVGGAGEAVGAGRRLGFDVVSQTLSHTSLGNLKQGDQVNLEPALTPNQPIGGHFVQGHVDGIGTVSEVQTDETDYRIKIDTPVEIQDYLVPKGSISVDGVSLTIADVDESEFEVAVIPTTLQLTTLSSLKVGDSVNLEVDMVVRSVFHAVRGMVENGRGGNQINMDMLRRAGFVEVES